MTDIFQSWRSQVGGALKNTPVEDTERFLFEGEAFGYVHDQVLYQSKIKTSYFDNTEGWYLLDRDEGSGWFREQIMFALKWFDLPNPKNSFIIKL